MYAWIWKLCSLKSLELVIHSFYYFCMNLPEMFMEGQWIDIWCCYLIKRGCMSVLMRSILYLFLTLYVFKYWWLKKILCTIWLNQYTQVLRVARCIYATTNMQLHEENFIFTVNLLINYIYSSYFHYIFVFREWINYIRTLKLCKNVFSRIYSENFIIIEATAAGKNW